MNRVDLHTHSTRSDGTYTPSELLDYARKKGLAAVALTDHDTVDGLDEIIEYAAGLRAAEPKSDDIPEVIPGIEFSTEYAGQDVHVVGLMIDYHQESFRRKLKNFVDSRTSRNLKICDLLTAHGMPITYEELLQAFPDCVITRAHYARYMLSKGYISTISEAFERYIGDSCPCFVPREKVTPFQAIELILEAGGIPILAHPMLYGLSEPQLEKLVAECKEHGLAGIEVYYPTHTQADERLIRRLAGKYHLLLSGGSDFHGDNKPGLDLGTGYGSLFVPEDALLAMKETMGQVFFADLDKTLLNGNSEISPAMKESLDRFIAAGNRLVLTSGRPLSSILEVRTTQKIDYPRMLIIANNGSLIYDCDAQTVIRDCRVSQEDIRFLVKEADKHQIHVHAYTESEIICRGWDDEMRFYTRRIHMPVRCVEDIADHIPEGSYKVQIIRLKSHAALERFRDDVAPLCADRLQMIFSEESYLEILPAQSGKGNGLRFVADYLHVPLIHTLAAGDAENDISMIQAAGTGIAMKNADPAVQACADIVTSRTNDEDGLSEILDNMAAQLLV